MKKKIIIIEDDLPIIETLQMLLEDEYELVVYKNAGLAYEQLKQGSQLCDVILLDLMMPEMNGWQFILLIEKDPDLKDLMSKVIIMSAFPNAVSDAYMRGLPILAKPFSGPEEIKEKIKEVIEKNKKEVRVNI